jgi:hypothetical protein
LLHELAYLVLGHCKGDNNTHRGVAEFETERSVRCSAKSGDVVIVIPGVQTITVHVGYGAMLLEFCGGQPNSFPDRLKFPATPNLPDLIG